MIGQTKTRLLGVTVLIAVFAVGGLTGAVVQRAAVADNVPPRTPTRGPSLFEMLKLTSEQQAKVCTIMKRRAEETRPHELEMQKIWNEHEPALRKLIDEANADIDSVLTPAQRAAKEQFRADRQKYFQNRASQDRAQRQSEGKGPRRGNPLGVTCPDVGGSPGGPHGPGWGGDSSRDKPNGASAPQSLPAPVKPEYQA
jgi:hypothetical protein